MWPSGCFPLGYPLAATGWLSPGWHDDVTMTLFSDIRCIRWEEEDCPDQSMCTCAMPTRTRRPIAPSTTTVILTRTPRTRVRLGKGRSKMRSKTAPL